MNYEINHKEKYSICQIDGNLDIFCISDLKKNLIKNIDEKKINTLVLDMKNVNHMDSSGIGFLAFFNKKLSGNEKKFFLLNVGLDVMSILKLASLESYFKIIDSQNEIFKEK